MKKNLRFNNKQQLFARLCFLVALIAVVFQNCKKDTHVIQQLSVTNPQIAAAKSWYEKTYPVKSLGQSLRTSSTGQTDLSQVIKPDWQHATVYERFNQQVLELPLDPSVKFSSALKNMTEGKLVSNRDYSRSWYIMLNDGTTYTAYVMTIIADSSYVNNNPDKLSRNTYNQRDADFSGQVLYFTPQGRYVSGWQYKNGRIITPQAKQQETVAQNTGSKKTASYNGENEYCTDWYWVTYLNGEAIDYEYLYTSCSSGGYGGGGGPQCPTSPNTNSGGRQAVNNMPPPPPPDDGGGFPPPTGGSGCTVTTPPIVDTAKFCDGVSPEQQQAIKNDLNTLKDADCLSKVLFETSASSIASYCVNSSLSVQAGYNPVTKSVIIKDPSTLSTANLQEEFFHAYQDKVMPGGTAQYLGAPGSANIEFEAKVIRDISTYMGLFDGTGSGGALSVKDADYEPWLADITNNYTQYPTSFTASQQNKYFDLMSKFVSENPGYSTNLINNTLNPTALFSLINISPCTH
jgi:hypothetical protein